MTSPPARDVRAVRVAERRRKARMRPMLELATTRRPRAALRAATLLLVFTAGCAGSSLPARPQAMSDGRTTRSFAAGAVADEMPAPDAPPSDAPTYTDASGVQGSGVAIANSDLVRGTATVLVDAPLPKVREAVLGFADYAEFMPHYQKSKMLGRNAAGARDVYMEIAAMHGAVKMWARLEVSVARAANGAATPSEGGVEKVIMRSVEGNVKELSGTWTLEPDGADKTKLTLEVFLEPSMPLPSSVLNNENVKGAVKGVVAMKKRAEGAK